MRDMRRLRVTVIARVLGLTVPIVALALVLRLPLLLLLPVSFWVPVLHAAVATASPGARPESAPVEAAS